MESRKEKFKRLANIRVNNALKQIDLIGNLSNKSTYEYSDEEIRKIFSEIESALRDTRSKFRSSKNKKRKFQI